MPRVTTQPSAIAIIYARSLLDLANESNSAAETGQELAGIAQILHENPVFREYLADPGISQERRTATVGKIFRGRVSGLLYNFLGVLNDHGRLRLLGQIAQAYDDLLDEQLGKVEVDVVTAQRLSDQEMEQVRQRISGALKKDAIVRQSVDESILGGLVVRVGDKVIDASVRQQLRAMQRQLLTASVRAGSSPGAQR